MTLNGAITELVLLSEHPMMPVIFKPGIQKVIETISELEAQPEPCEDAVSRAEIKRMINCINDHHAITPYKSVGAVTEHLTRIASNLPPVTPKQRTGRWIPQDHNKRVGNISTCVYYSPICSECGKVGNETYKYCPHCGAKMEGDAE